MRAAAPVLVLTGSTRACHRCAARVCVHVYTHACTAAKVTSLFVEFCAAKSEGAPLDESDYESTRVEYDDTFGGADADDDEPVRPHTLTLRHRRRHVCRAGIRARVLKLTASASSFRRCVGMCPYSYGVCSYGLGGRSESTGVEYDDTFGGAAAADDEKVRSAIQICQAPTLPKLLLANISDPPANAAFWGMPTAKAEGDIGKVSVQNVFRHLQMNVGPRCSPSACAEMMGGSGHRPTADEC